LPGQSTVRSSSRITRSKSASVGVWPRSRAISLTVRPSIPAFSGAKVVPIV
jgi:hypothetical protein